jgi:hypothetical protein
MSSQRRRSPEAGFSLVELLVSTAVMLTITAAIFTYVNPAQSTAQVLPEAADLQQRMRVGSDTLFRELIMAGAGPYQGATRGSLSNFFAPILPRRGALTGGDARNVFRPDAITLTYLPNSYAQTTIDKAMPPNSSELKVTYPPNCPDKVLCGFETGMVVIIFDTAGHSDTFEITNVQDAAGHLQHRGSDLSYKYEVGAIITQVVTNTFYLDTATRQLKKFDGGSLDLPIVDNVVGLQFEYFGDPNPPKAPKPASGTANCLYDSSGNYANLPVLTANEGSLAALTATILTDGPWCGGGDSQYDADLLRIRKVRVTLRMQAAAASVRGLDTLVFANPGTALDSKRMVPDYTVRFDVSPRNLNLTR